MEISVGSLGASALTIGHAPSLFSSPQGSFVVIDGAVCDGFVGRPLAAEAPAASTDAAGAASSSYESIEITAQTAEPYANDFDLLSLINNVDTSLFDLNTLEDAAALSESVAQDSTSQEVYDDEIPELEDVPGLALGQSLGSISGVDDFGQLLMFEEIPELEDVPTEQQNDAVPATSNTLTETNDIVGSAVALGDLDCYIEEVEVPFNQTSPSASAFSSSPVYVAGCSSPLTSAGSTVSEGGLSPPSSSDAFVNHQLIIPPSPVAKRRVGRLHHQQPFVTTTSPTGVTEPTVLPEDADIPADAGFEEDDDFEGDEMRQRRISQVSVSSYCSSVGVGLWSPASSSSAYSSGSAGAGSVAGCSYSSTAGSDSEYSCTDNNARSNGKRKAATKKGAGGRRSKFTPEDRKERKKAQNRTAAERYRQKRRAADDDVDEIKQRMEDANSELRTEVTKLEAELSCLKRLMREMLQAKGIEIPPPSKKART